MGVSLNTIKRTVAATELLLISPAALFMTALFVRNLQPQQYEPAHRAQRMVMWYAVRPWTLWVLLIGLPFAVRVTGRATLLRSWNITLNCGTPRGKRPPRSTRTWRR